MSPIRILLIHPPTLYTVSTSYFSWVSVQVCAHVHTCTYKEAIGQSQALLLWCCTVYPVFWDRFFFFFFWPRAHILGKGWLATESPHAAFFLCCWASVFHSWSYPLGFCTALIIVCEHFSLYSHPFFLLHLQLVHPLCCAEFCCVRYV